jgi:hypothetical protein
MLFNRFFPVPSGLAGNVVAYGQSVSVAHIADFLNPMIIPSEESGGMAQKLMKGVVMRIILWLLRLLFFLLIALVGLLLPVLLFMLRTTRDLVSISFAATVNGPAPFADRLAGEWTERLIEMGAPRDRIDQVFALCQFMARLIIVLGWLVSIVFTVEILRVVFGYFI